MYQCIERAFDRPSRETTATFRRFCCNRTEPTCCTKTLNGTSRRDARAMRVETSSARIAQPVSSSRGRGRGRGRLDASSSSRDDIEYRCDGYRAIRCDDDDDDDDERDARVVRVKVDCGPVSAYTGGRYDGERVTPAWQSTANTPPSERLGRGAERRTYAFERVLPRDGTDWTSEIVSVTAERPLGIVFEEDADGRVRVGEFVPGGFAAKASEVASLAPFGAQCCREGDILRAFTATQVVYKTTAALTGDLSGTKRVRTLYGADDKDWKDVSAALANGRVADGPVTIVVERDLDRARAEAWPRVTKEIEFRGLGEETTAEKKTRERFLDDDDDDADRTNANIAFAAAIASFVGLILAGFS